MDIQKKREEIKKKVKKWEEENWFAAAILQKECLNYKHYIQEVLDDLGEIELLRYV